MSADLSDPGLPSRRQPLRRIILGLVVFVLLVFGISLPTLISLPSSVVIAAAVGLAVIVFLAVTVFYPSNGPGDQASSGLNFNQLFNTFAIALLMAIPIFSFPSSSMRWELFLIT